MSVRLLSSPLSSPIKALTCGFAAFRPVGDRLLRDILVDGGRKKST